MSRYPDNFKQSMPADDLKRLPEYCTYEGDARDLLHLRGLLIPTKDIERLVYVGEREMIWVDDPERGRWTPWKGVALTELDENGNVVVSGYEQAPSLPTAELNAMSSAELGSLGFTDGQLIKLALETFGEDWEPDWPWSEGERRKRFDRLMAALYG